MQLTDDWRDYIACLHVDPSLFFDPETVDLALSFCQKCDVRTECLTDALMHGELGVRGGTTEEEREDRTLPKEIGPVKVIVDYALFVD